MPQPIYVCEATIRRWEGPNRTVRLPGASEDISFGVHGAIAQHYGLDSMDGHRPNATTIDYVIAAAGG